MKAQAVLGTTSTLIYTSNTATDEAVTIFMTNTDQTVSEPVVLEISPDGVNWYPFYQATIPAGATHILHPVALQSGDRIRGTAANTANIIQVVVLGVER